MKSGCAVTRVELRKHCFKRFHIGSWVSASVGMAALESLKISARRSWSAATASLKTAALGAIIQFMPTTSHHVLAVPIL
jgi:hypothetical protein